MEAIIAILVKHILTCFLQLIVCKERAALISQVSEEFWQINHRLHSCNSCKIITVSSNSSGFCFLGFFLTLRLSLYLLVYSMKASS